VGVVSLHATAPPGNGMHMAWPPGWRPVVAHVQTYVPYVLMQTEAIANPLDNLRRYLLHEGRNELNATSELASQLKSMLAKLLATDDPPGQVRPWLRKWLPMLERDTTVLASDLAPGLNQLERMLPEIAERVDKLLDVERAENLALLGRLIERQRNISTLGLKFESGQNIHHASWIPLRETLDKALTSFDRDFKAQRVWWSIDQVNERLQLLTQDRLWSWVIGDLVHNIAKYANTNSGVQVSLVSVNSADGRRDGYRLRFENESVFDPELDKADRLILHGVQGSAGKPERQRKLSTSKISRVGAGIGLWGADQLATALGLKLVIEIRQQTRDPTLARYHFDLMIPQDMLRR
jgi:hypothetical protein